MHGQPVGLDRTSCSKKVKKCCIHELFRTFACTFRYTRLHACYKPSVTVRVAITDQKARSVGGRWGWEFLKTCFGTYWPQLPGSSHLGPRRGGDVQRWSDDAPTAMLILDGSGSMWGRLAPANQRQDRHRARQARHPSRDTVFNAASVLFSFGHRRRGDCNDVELIAGPDSPRQAVPRSGLRSLNPRGTRPAHGRAQDGSLTPLAHHVRRRLSSSATTPTIASQDSLAPSANGRFAKTSPGVAIQVIGIGVPANERPRMACIAEMPRCGHFYDITDSDGLNAALDETTKLAILSPGQPLPESVRA